jgi:protein gp37
MAQLSAIEWTEATWNPLTGCTKISPGCKNCYADRMARRLQAMGQPNYANGFALALHEHMLDAPLRWKRPRRVFVNSMSDLFQDGVPVDFIKKVFAVMGSAAHHQFQVLTKRSERLLALSESLEWMPNIWMGVSVESRKYAVRIDHLRQTGARIKFLSLEPLLSPLGKLDLSGIDWVIVGGESGPRARPMDPAWAREVRDQCIASNVPFFFKQWGGKRKSRTGRVLDGRTWNGFPRSPAGAPKQRLSMKRMPLVAEVEA